MAETWGENDAVVEQPSAAGTDFGADDEIVQDGAWTRGWNKAKQRMAISGSLATGNTRAAATPIAEADEYARANPGTREGAELRQAWERGEGISGGIKEVADEFSKDWNDADSFGGSVKSAGRNLQALGSGIVEQIPNAVAPMTGMAAGFLGGAKAGGAIGGAVGSVIPGAGTAAGAALGGTIGGIGGAWAGASVGNTAVEGGGMAQEALAKAGIDPRDTAAVTAFLDANSDQIMKEAAIKGGIIGAVDVATAGIGGRILNAPARAATGRALSAMGIDAADDAAVKAAMQSPRFAELIAGDAVYQAAKSGAGNVARNVGVAAMEPAGEFAGEYLGTGVATGEWDEKNAALEAFSSIGQSAGMFAGQKAYQAITRPSSAAGQPGADSTAAADQPPAPDLIQPTPTAENPAPAPVERPDPANGPLSAAASLLPSAASTPVPDTAHIDPPLDPQQGQQTSPASPEEERIRAAIADVERRARLGGMTPVLAAERARLGGELLALQQPAAEQQERPVIVDQRSDFYAGQDGFTRSDRDPWVNPANNRSSDPYDRFPGIDQVPPRPLEGELLTDSVAAPQQYQAGGVAPVRDPLTGEVLGGELQAQDQRPGLARQGETFEGELSPREQRALATAFKKRGAAELARKSLPAPERFTVEQQGETFRLLPAPAAASEAAPNIAEPASITGREIDREWSEFTPESGTLAIPRAEMPQIKAEHRGAMVRFLNARGIQHEEQTVPASTLKPTQAEFSREKVEKAKGFTGGDRAILVSSDGHVVDGHHQWLARREAGDDVRVIRLEAPIRDLLPVVAEFPSATQDTGAQPMAIGRQPKAPKRGQRRSVDRDRDSVVQAAIRLGGITNQWKQDTTGDAVGNKNIPGVGALWSDKTGTSLDDMASLLDQHGYVPAGEMDKDGGVSWLQAAIRDELGGRAHYAPDSARQIELAEQELLNRYAEAVARAIDEREAEYARIEAEYGPDAAADVRSFDEAMTARSEHLDGAIEDVREQQEAVVDGELATEADAARRDDELRQVDGREGRPAGEDVGEAFQLQQQTEAGLAEQDRQQQAREQAEAEARRKDEQKTQADAELNDFTLTGSDRPADVGAARGQNDLFGTQPARAEAEAPTAQPPAEPRQSPVEVARERVTGNHTRADYVGQVYADYIGDDSTTAAEREDLRKEFGISGLPTPESFKAAAGKYWDRHWRARTAKKKAGEADARRIERELQVEATIKAGLQASAQMDAQRAEAQGQEQELGSFGPIFREFRHDAAGAIARLKEAQDGEAVAALHHPQVGDIDLVWGKEGTGKSDGLGLAKLVRYHPEVLGDLQGFISGLAKDEARSGKNRIRLESPSGFASVRLDWDGEAKTWLMTAFEKKAATGTRTDTTDSMSAGDTARRSNGLTETVAQPQNAQPTPPAKPKAKRSKPAAEKPAESKIEDFGERLEGARKFNDYKQKLDAAKDLDVAAVPLSKSWPVPDYQELLDAGSDPWGVAFMRAAREEIANKPSKGYKLQRWVEQVQGLRETAMRAASEPAFAERVRTKAMTEFASLQGLIGRADLYAEFGHEVALKGISFRSHHYSVYRGEKDVTKWVVEGKPEKSALSNWPKELAVGNTREEAMAAFAAQHAAMKAKPDAEVDAGPSVRFDVYTDRTTRKSFIAKKNGKRLVRMQEFDSVREAMDYLKSNQAALEARYEAMKTPPPTRNEDNAPRIGADHRNGQDVTPELFGETFGFRGVQFGNYVENKRRIKDLNDAYDGLMDMAGILNIPPRALSLNGELGLAFGARGTGGPDPAKAHYERDSVVINLTKTNGAGSLAHEWWHALDNYLSRSRGEPDAFLTDKPYPAFAKSTRTPLEGVRPALLAAFKELNQAVGRTRMKQRAEELDKMRTKDYWSTTVEMTARAFESYVVNKLDGHGIRSDYLANIISEEGFNREEAYPYPTAAEIPAIRAAYDNIFSVIETRTDDAGNVALYSRAGLSPSSVVVGKTPANPISLAEAEAAAQAFLADYNGNIPLTYRIRKTQRELYGPQGDVDQLGIVKGAYHPERGVFTLAADHLSDTADVRETLRHEILGHYGLDTFKPEDKQALLEKILASKAEPSLKSAWDFVARVYADKSDLVQAEEVFTHLAEQERSAALKAVDFLRAALIRLLRNVGFKRAAITRSELLREVEVIAKGIRNGSRTYQGGNSESRLRQDLVGEARTAEGDGVRYSLDDSSDYRMGTPTKGIPLMSARMIASKFQTQGLKVEAVATPADLPPHIFAGIQRAGVEGRVRGLYHKATGTSYIIASNLRDTKQAVSIVLHEAIGHGGIKQLLGDRLTPVMRDIFNSIPEAERLRLMRNYQAQVQAARMSPARAEQLIAEEYVAHLAETDPQNSLLDRIVSMLRNWIRENFGDRIAVQWTRNDLVQLLAEARREVATGGRDQARKGGRQPAMAFALDDGAIAQQFEGTARAYGGEAAWRAAQDAGRTKLEYRQWVQVRTPAFKAWFGEWENGNEQGGAGGTGGAQGRGDPDGGAGSIAAATTGVSGNAESLRRPDSRVRRLDGRGRVDPAGGSVAASGREAAGQVARDWRLDPQTGEPAVLHHGTRDSFTVFDLNHPNRKDKGWLGRGVYVASDRRLADAYAKLKQGEGQPQVMGLFVNVRNPAVATLAHKQALRHASQEYIDAQTASLIERGHDGVVLELPDGTLELMAFEPTSVKSATENVGAFGSDTADIRFSLARPASSIAAAWDAPEPSKMDDLLYVLQNKQIDMRRVVEAVSSKIGAIKDEWNPYLQEELFHGRSAKGVQDFLQKEMRPLLASMRREGVGMAELERFLHARHAPEANAHIARINPNEPDLQDGGSGMTNQEAADHLAGIAPERRRVLDALAQRVDAINASTRQVLVAGGLETAETVQAWEAAYQHYVPLQREDAEQGMGIGQGFSVKGSAAKRRTGSKRAVVDIMGNIALQRERAIVRAEKSRVAQAAYALALKAPNPGFWMPVNPEAARAMTPAQQQAMADELTRMGLDPADAQNFVKEPVQRYVDPRTGLVAERINPALRNADHVLTTRIDGKDRYVFFNRRDQRAQRMVGALKNLDADQLGRLMQVSAKITRWFAAVNTQYNPVFGIVNITRDVQAALLQLSTTPIRGAEKAVLRDTMPAMRGIYAALRAERGDTAAPQAEWAKLFEEFRNVGGQTGFRDQFADSTQRAEALRRELDPEGWMDGPLGKVFTANGTLKVPMAQAQNLAGGLFGWLTDYNDTLENSVRLAAYKAAKDRGMSQQQAASVAKNLTVNFNRKGQIATQAGALYAFFNAAMQGTTRMIQTLKGPAGKKIILGGLTLGALQALTLVAAGFGDDDPPEFVRERSLVIPVGDGKYVSIPMPLGFHVIPSTSRILTEWALSGFKDTTRRFGDFMALFADTFNPIGNAGWSMQTLAPSALDPIAALAENRDWTGKPIAQEDFNSLRPTPGHARAKDTASELSKAIAYWANLASGGTDYKPGLISPTPDQIDYLIGQLTGGVGREYLKSEQTVTSLWSGEELPPHKVPLLGRFYGDTTGQSSEGARFYNNLREINLHRAEIEGRRRDRKDVAGYLRDNPTARLAMSGPVRAESEVRRLRQAKRAALEAGQAGRVKMIDAQITRAMRQFNERVAVLEG